MRRMLFLILVTLLVFLFGCVSQPPVVGDLEYREIPEALLQECVLPEAPLSNADLSDAFAQAWQCGDQGNRDKRRIKEL